MSDAIVENDLSICCPICAYQILTIDEDGNFDEDDFSTCNHLRYAWVDCGVGFLHITDDIQTFLDAQDEADAFDIYKFVSNKEKSPFVDEIIEHIDGGMANGPIQIAAYYGFRRSVNVDTSVAT